MRGSSGPAFSVTRLDGAAGDYAAAVASHSGAGNPQNPQTRGTRISKRIASSVAGCGPVARRVWHCLGLDADPSIGAERVR